MEINCKLEAESRQEVIFHLPNGASIVQRIDYSEKYNAISFNIRMYSGNGKEISLLDFTTNSPKGE